MDESTTLRHSRPVRASAATAALRDPKSGDAYARHIATVRACTLCSGVTGPPVVGPSPGARIMLIGQAPGPREPAAGHPFAWTAGRTLFQWFARYGVDEATFRARVHMAAVIRCFPGRTDSGGDRTPSPQEIRNCFPFVEREVELLEPALIIPVGRLAIDRFLDFKTLEESIGRRFDGRVGHHPVSVIPLPHPSGRSTWLFRPGNRARLDRALDLIATHPAWQMTFA